MRLIQLLSSALACHEFNSTSVTGKCSCYWFFRGTNNIFKDSQTDIADCCITINSCVNALLSRFNQGDNKILTLNMDLKGGKKILVCQINY